MKKSVRLLLAGIFLLPSFLSLAQGPEPFEGCPGVSVAITRPGFNLNLVPHQIYLIDSSGAVVPSGDPINLQINAFGLNNADGFLYGLYQGFNVANPYLARVGKNGRYDSLGTVEGPPLPPFSVAIINTTAGTIDDEDNYYFTAISINLQNILLPPNLYVGKIERVSALQSGVAPLTIVYKQITIGTCLPDLLLALQNPLTGVLQDIAFNPADGYIYTYFPGAGGTGGKLGWFDPNAAAPIFNCFGPAATNPPTTDLSGLYIGSDTALYILTIDGKFYKADIETGAITSIAQTTLPLDNNNLRGDMASCIGKRELQPFDSCPGRALAITRPGINNTGGPHQIYSINPFGSINPSGHPIDLQINGFGLNSQDGFLYGMHEVSDIFGPKLARVDANGDFVDLNILNPPAGGGNSFGVINTAAATMDGSDNYYFTAVVLDTTNIFNIPRLFLGTIRDVSKLKPGDSIQIRYRRVFLGSCIDEILSSLSNPANGLFQDIAYNPKDGKIYTYIQSHVSPADGKLASFLPGSRFMVLRCNNPRGTNPETQDLSGMHADGDGNLFILTIDGKYYKADYQTGNISLVAQTDLPLAGNNLRGDMASCVKTKHHFGYKEEDEGVQEDMIAEESSLRVSPNPVNGDEAIVYLKSTEQATVEVKMMDMNGHANKTRKQVALVKGDNQVRIPVKGLPGGMYAVILVYPSGKTSAVKFIRL